jgi:hypothetical protein
MINLPRNDLVMSSNAAAEAFFPENKTRRTTVFLGLGSSARGGIFQRSQEVFLCPK